MIGSGNYPIYHTHVELLCKTIFEIVHEKYHLKEEVITLCSTKVSSLKKIFKSFNNKALIIPIFWQIPFKSDNITGLVFSNKDPNFSFMKENDVNFNSPNVTF